MAFNPNMTVPDYALKDFKDFAHLLETQYFIKPGLVKRIYLHWSVAPHNVTFGDYNSMVLLDNGKLKLAVTGDFRDNITGLNNNPIHSHTWRRNSEALGLSIDGLDGATVNNFGPDAPSQMELLYLCGGLAAIAKAYSVDVNGKVVNGTTHQDNNGNEVNTKGEYNVLTHAECAVIDAYPSERIDLGVLEPLPQGVGLTTEMRTKSGNTLRACAHRIKLML